MTFQTEFPDYPAADMPALPEGFSDTSWKNDACPSYESPSFRIWIDYIDPEQREIIGTHRFIVVDITDNESETVLETDSWNEVLEFVTDEAIFQSIMAKHGIHIIPDDSEPRCGRMYHVMQGDRRIKLAYDLAEVREFILTMKEA